MKSIKHGDIAGRRIALFAGAYNHIRDGVSLTLNRLVRYLESRGADTLVFAPTSKEPPPIKHAGRLVVIPSLPFPGRSDYRITLGLPRKASALLERFNPDLVHIASPDYLGLKALQWANTRAIPAVTSFHTHFGAYLKYFTAYNWWYRMDLLEDTLWRYGRWFYPQCQHIYVPSRSMADELRSKGISNGIRLWPRGVDPDHFNPSWRSFNWRQGQGIQDSEVVVTYVGRLVWEKGLTVFANVISELESRNIPHRSMMVGDGPAHKRLAEQLPNTIFTGRLVGEDLSKAYASSDVFLFPSDTETFGNVTLEAMASGLPTVCANASGSDALVRDTLTGFLATPGDAEDFTYKILQLINNPQLITGMGQRARQRALKFDWNHVMAQMSWNYEEIWNRPVRRDGAVRRMPKPVLVNAAA